MIPEKKYDVIIAGSGLGGLLCGTLLSKEGMRVCILERGHSAGGCLSTFRRGEIEFGTGVHYFGSMDPGQPLYRYWKYAGLADSLSLERMNPDGFDRIGFRDGEYPIAMGRENFIQQLTTAFPEEGTIFEKYMAKLDEIGKAFPLYHGEPQPGSQEDRFRTIRAFDFYHELVSNVKNPMSRSRIFAILTGNNLLYAGNREKTPLHVPALINHSFISSAWRPVGGSGQIMQRLADRIRENGGEMHLNSGVTGIEHAKGQFVIRTEQGVKLFSDRFISAIHPAKTIELMDETLFKRSFTQRMALIRNTCSSFALFLVMKENAFPYLDHNYYYHDSESVWNEERLTGWPSGYMLCTPPPASGTGHSNSVVVLSPIPYEPFAKWKNTTTGDRGEEYQEFKMKTADRLLRLAGKRFPELRPAIRSMDISTPLTWRDYTGTPEGSMYGIERDFGNPLITQILPVTKFPGLYFTGQNTNLHGVLGVTIGAVLTCGAILGLEYLRDKIKNS